MLADRDPAWLLAWREQQSRPQPAPAPPPVVVKPAPPTAPPGPKVPLRMRGQAAAIGILEPEPWDYDGCKRREIVFDIELRPPRVVRKVGWHHCLKCRRPFFSEDVIRLRLCNGSYGCRGDDHRYRVK
jgi:hypothetical protein